MSQEERKDENLVEEKRPYQTPEVESVKLSPEAAESLT